MTKNKKLKENPVVTGATVVPCAELADKSASTSGIVAHRRVELSCFNGPIPPADELAKYEEILPGAADRLVTMAEKEQNSRIELNRKSTEIIQEEYRETSALRSQGQKIAGFIILLSLVSSVICGIVGATEVGCALALVAGEIGYLVAFQRKDKTDSYPKEQDSPDANARKKHIDAVRKED